MQKCACQIQFGLRVRLVDYLVGMADLATNSRTCSKGIKDGTKLLHILVEEFKSMGALIGIDDDFVGD
jgi:hypothetical protein